MGQRTGQYSLCMLEERAVLTDNRARLVKEDGTVLETGNGACATVMRGSDVPWEIS